MTAALAGLACVRYRFWMQMRTRHGRSVLGLALLVLFAAAGASMVGCGDEDDDHRPPVARNLSDCPSGTLGCDCSAAGECDEGLTCNPADVAAGQRCEDTACACDVTAVCDGDRSGKCECNADCVHQRGCYCDSFFGLCESECECDPDCGPVADR